MLKHINGAVLLYLVGIALVLWHWRRTRPRRVAQPPTRPGAGATLIFQCATCRHDTSRTYHDGPAFVRAAQDVTLRCDPCVVAEFESQLTEGVEG